MKERGREGKEREGENSLEERGRTLGLGSFMTFIILAIILLFFSIFLIYRSMAAYAQGDLPISFSYLIFSLMGLILSSYFLMHLKNVRLGAVKRAPSVFTMVECLQCGFKNIRSFQKGDYVLKRAEGCPKCSQSMLITSIYAESEQKP